MTAAPNDNIALAIAYFTGCAENQTGRTTQALSVNGADVGYPHLL